MRTPPAVQRQIDLELSADEAWRLIATVEGWRQWMVDEADLGDITPGRVGSVLDDDVRRLLSVEEVEAGRRVVFSWLDTATGDASRVTLDLDLVPATGSDDGRRMRLTITEEWTATACAACPLRAGQRWDLRECLLCLAARSTCLV